MPELPASKHAGMRRSSLRNIHCALCRACERNPRRARKIVPSPNYDSLGGILAIARTLTVLFPLSISLFVSFIQFKILFTSFLFFAEYFYIFVFLSPTLIQKKKHNVSYETSCIPSHPPALTPPSLFLSLSRNHRKQTKRCLFILPRRSASGENKSEKCQIRGCRRFFRADEESNAENVSSATFFHLRDILMKQPLRSIIFHYTQKNAVCILLCVPFVTYA